MAKPSWITIVSGSTGSGSGTRSLKASSHTGRSSRSDSIKGVTSGGASDSVVLSQVGASEFIMVDKTSYSVTALGGTVKITGTSNSPSLKVSQLSDPSSLSNFALKVNGTAYTWNGNHSHEISGDPGASASYTFEISFDVAENQTESSKDITFMLTDSGNRYPSSDEITITQAAGIKTMGDANISFVYPLLTIPASGGSSSPSLEFNIPWGWNGRKSGGGTYTQDNINYTAKYSLVYENEDPYNWSIDENTGVVTADSLGTNVASEAWQKAMVEITVNGKVYDEVANIFQDKNDRTSSLLAEVTLDDIPASGGLADSPTLVSATGKIDYSSGESQEISLTSSDVTITLSKTVNGSNLGSTIKARTKLDTVKATITWNGSSVTQSIDVYQQANQVTYSSVNAVSFTEIVPKTGGDVDIAANVSPNQTATYTSGATRDITDFNYEVTSIPTWVGVDELTLTLTVDKNITGLTRNTSVRLSITGEGNKSTTASISIRQESMVLPSWSLGETETYHKNLSYLAFTVSDPDNVGYMIEVSETWMSHVSGVEEQINCSQNLTGSSRTGTVQLIVAAGGKVTVISTCTITQESKILPSWNVPSTFRFDSIGQSSSSPTGLDLNITDPDNVGWTIEGPSYVGNSLVSGDSLPISGIGNKSLSLGPDVNTSSERTFDLVLKASTGAVIATCNCTQAATTSPYVTANISLGYLTIPFDVWDDGIGSKNKIRITPMFLIDGTKEIYSTEFVELPMPNDDDSAVAHPVLKCDNVQLLPTDVITGIEFKIVDASDLETEYLIQMDGTPVSMNVHSSLQPDKTFVFKADGQLGGWYSEYSDKITLVNGVNVITITSTSPVITVTSIS